MAHRRRILPLLTTLPTYTAALKSKGKHGWFINEECDITLAIPEKMGTHLVKQNTNYPLSLFIFTTQKHCLLQYLLQEPQNQQYASQ
jgi:hypothetical protein